MKKHNAGFGFQVAAIVMGSVAGVFLILTAVFGLIGWRKGQPLK